MLKREPVEPVAGVNRTFTSGNPRRNLTHVRCVWRRSLIVDTLSLDDTRASKASQPASRGDVADDRWTSLYRVATAATLVSLALLPVAIAVYVFSPPPGSVVQSFAQLQANVLVGLVDLDLVMLIDFILMIPIYLALWVALRRANESFMALGTTLGLVGIAVYLTTNPCFSMLSLSNQYANATTDAQRAMLLASGQAMLTVWSGTAYDVSYVMGGVAGLIIAAVMLRSHVFNKATAYVGIVLNALMLVPPTVGTIGLVLSLLSLVPLAIWYVLIARQFYLLGSGTEPISV